MSGQEVESSSIPPVHLDAALMRRAAVHIADGVAAQHPHPLDDDLPELAGRLIAQDPAVRAQVDELLDAIGYHREKQ